MGGREFVFVVVDERRVELFLNLLLQSPVLTQIRCGLLETFAIAADSSADS